LISLNEEQVVSSSYRTIWLSDIHLGTSASRADDLLNFLAEVSAGKIYLLGDIIDLERMKTRAIFPDTHRNVLTRFVQLSQSGTEIIYIPGNHDFQLRELAGKDIYGVPVMLEASHHTCDGKRLLVTHGDQLDHQVRQGTSLEQFGAAAYRVLVNLDVIVNQLRNHLGREYLPISAGIKQRLNSANEYIRRFEETAARHAAERDFDGIVCGHIHRPCLREIDGIRYANDGDWIEHRTALAESDDGHLQILHWKTTEPVIQPIPQAPPLAA
jgi:UDP-2,3-diacylglucosamine pyrophosphatase LpxH